MYLDEALAKEFNVSFTIPKGSKLAGLTVQRAGLRGVNGLFLYEIVRDNGTRLPAVSSDTELAAGDILYFTGDMEGVSFLLKFPGLQHTSANQVAALDADIIHRRLVQVVVSSHGPLVHKTLAQANFRASYGAAVVGIHRAGHSVTGNIAEVPLQAGDVLVLEAGPEFIGNFQNNRAFSLINEVPNSSPQKASKMWIALILTTGMVLTQVGEWGLGLGGVMRECGEVWGRKLWGGVGKVSRAGRHGRRHGNVLPAFPPAPMEWTE
jgi:K+/H+ antiporter YhaU regulatory subunit KhtT